MKLDENILLAPMGVLAPVSTHTGPSAKKTVAKTLLGKTAHFGFCPPKIGFFGGLGGVPEIFFSHWNLHIFVTKEPLQNFKTVTQTLLGETAHFGF